LSRFFCDDGKTHGQLPVVHPEYECHAIRLIEDEDQDYAHHADQFFARNLFVIWECRPGLPQRIRFLMPLAVVESKSQTYLLRTPTYIARRDSVVLNNWQ